MFILLYKRYKNVYTGIQTLKKRLYWYTNVIKTFILFIASLWLKKKSIKTPAIWTQFRRNKKRNFSCVIAFRDGLGVLAHFANFALKEISHVKNA